MNYRLLFISPLLSGLLLAISFPPFKLFFPSFIALVPLLYFLDNESSNLKASLGAAASGFLFWGLLLYWITLYTSAGYLVLLCIMSMNLVIFALVTRALKTRLNLPLFVSSPLVWTAVEYIHAHGDLAFTWGQLAYSLTHYPLLLQMASVTGPYGITFWIVCINVSIYEMLKRTLSGRRWSSPAAVLCLLFTGPVLLGLYRYNQFEQNAPQVHRLKVCYVQPSVPQEIKWSPQMRDSTFKLLAELSLVQKENQPRLVVWPEAAAPAYLRLDQYYRNYVGEIAKELKAYLLTGAQEYRYNQSENRYDSFNSAFLFSPEGQIIEYYDKIHLVPISERMPYEHIFTSLKDIDVGGSHFTPGTRHVVFPLGQESFGLLICFESSFPELSRELARRGAGFLVNITNDAWFERTSAVYQHSSFLVLRAIEQRRDIVRAANTGISLFYDRLGRRRRATALYERVSTTDSIFLNQEITFYCRYGDWPAYFVSTASLLLVLLSLLPGRFRPLWRSSKKNKKKSGQ